MKLANPSRWAVFLIALLVPVLAAMAFATTLANPDRHVRSVVAAVVNNDEPVELQGQIVPLGRQLAAALVEGQGLAEGEDGKQNFTWAMTNDELAAEGLRDGTYAAVVTIPPEFSAAATSTVDPDGEATKALIEVTFSPRTRLADEAMTNTIIRAALASLGHDLTGTFLDNIFLGFNTLGDELGVAAEGARSLADGARELASGVHELADGTNQVADGANQLAAGTRELAGGMGQLAGGMREYAQGASQFADGVGGLRDGSKALAGGAGDLATGARQLAGGAGELADGTSELSDGLGQLAGGAQELADGLGQISDLVGDAPDQLDNLAQYLIGGASDVRDLADQVAGAGGSIENIISEICAIDPDGEACRALQEYLGDSEALQQLLGQVAGGMYQLADGLEGVGDPEGIFAQIQQFTRGFQQLADGARQLSDGLDQAHDGSKELSSGAHQVAGGAGELATGLEEYAAGVREFDQGVGQLHGGAKELSSGAHSLANAGSEVASGAGALSSGTGDLASGLDELAAGTGALADGTDEFSDGTDQLADGLHEATEAIPRYPDGKRETLAETIAEPMAIDGASPAKFRWLACFGVLALWLGGLWLVPRYPAVARNAASSTRSAAGLTWSALKVPAIVAVAQGLAVGIVVGLIAATSVIAAIGFTVLAILMSLAFTAVQRGLVAHLGWGGIALTVLIGIFAIATALLSAMPAAATKILSWLPIGPAISATQGVEIAGGISVAPILGLLAWGAAGVVALLLATRREQTRG